MSTTVRTLDTGIVLTTFKAETGMQLSLSNSTLKIVTFTVDLTGSLNLIMLESLSLVNTTLVQPLSTSTVATIQLSPKWKLSLSFRYSLAYPENSILLALIADDINILQALVNLSINSLRSVDTNSFDPSMIPSTLSSFIDPFFPPTDDSVNLGASPKLDKVIQWRRPKDFFTGDFSLFDSIDPNDINQGSLGNCWCMCAFSCLAERPELVKRLFRTTEVNDKGIYQLNFCNGGEWVRVTVDDYFPCYPRDTPIFGRAHGNELWVLLLEKAYAKLHGSYALLVAGQVVDAMMDLTGCPTRVIEFASDEGKQMLANDLLWPAMVNYDKRGALISASTPGTDIYSGIKDPSGSAGIVPGHAYTILSVKEALGNRLVNMRNPWGRFEWNGNWSESSPLWTPEMMEIINPNFDATDGTFWISLDDVLSNFYRLNICSVDNYHEARAKGLFERKVVNGEENVYSNKYYIIQSARATSVCIGLHQEDERNYGAKKLRGFIDMGIVVLKFNNGTYQLFKAQGADCERQVEITIDIEADTPYLIWPRTTGCYLSRPPGVTPDPFEWGNGNDLHPLFEWTLKDVFRKANVIEEDLVYSEFNDLMQQVNISYTEAQFQEFVSRFPSTHLGLTSDGFIEFIREKYKELGDATIKNWMMTWGYDQDLYSVKSRSYAISLHSYEELQFEIKSINIENMSDRINQMLLQGSGVQKSNLNGVQLYCLNEDQANSFSYGVYNSGFGNAKVRLDCSRSVGVEFCSKSNIVEYIVPGKSWKTLIYSQLARGINTCNMRTSFRVTTLS